MRTTVFVSASMGEPLLREVLQRHAGRRDVTVAVRGVLPGEGLLAGMRRLRRLCEGAEGVRLVIEPRLFREYGVQAVPAVAVEGIGRRATALGLAHDAWVKERIEQGEAGALGVRGQTWPVAEPDLLQAIAERAAAVDWQALGRRARARSYEAVQRDAPELPQAAADAERRFAPWYAAAADIADGEGRVIVAAGSRVNLLAVRPFTRRLIVFDARDPLQVAFALEEAQAAQALGQGAVLAATRLPQGRGWEGYSELAGRLGSHVYLAGRPLLAAWGVRAVPSVVTADNARREFVIREAALEAGDARP
ncbi:MAG: hypothetical protein HUK26_07245 [Duodenibacillus sp.]|nr:hypothetical protein [Duodenibacillus sp.]